MLNSFWLTPLNEYSRLLTKADKVLLQFSTSWLCEHRFSALIRVISIETKIRQRGYHPAMEDSLFPVSSLKFPNFVKIPWVKFYINFFLFFFNILFIFFLICQVKISIFIQLKWSACLLFFCLLYFFFNKMKVAHIFLLKITVYII